MGKSEGSAPDPVPLKILKGIGHGRDSMGRLIPDVPRFERSAPEPPPWLSEQARAAWEAIAPELEALGLLKIQDGLMFTALCECWATYVAALARVRAKGLTIVNPKTLMEHKNPALTALEVAGRDLLRYTQEFGLTPAAELNLGKPPRPDAVMQIRSAVRDGECLVAAG